MKNNPHSSRLHALRIAENGRLENPDKKSGSDNASAFPKIGPGSLSGFRALIIHSLVWVNVISICLFSKKSFRASIATYRLLRNRYLAFRNKDYQVKYASVAGRYQFNLNTPAWPSATFNRYVRHMLKKIESPASVGVQTLVLAITKKCGFQCAHCVEWNQLNQPEKLTRHDLLHIIEKFKKLGTTQVQLSGGEPLSRFKDILFLLRKAPKGLDIWTYTNGYTLSAEKCEKLRKAGLTGVIISIDNHIPERHDAFRGKTGAWMQAVMGIRHAREAGLGVAISCCVTREYCSLENLFALADLVSQHGAMFLQLMEPRAEGHFAHKDVLLRPEHIRTLEEFYTTLMHRPEGKAYPIITYHPYQSRRIGCQGAGREFLYVDTDGMVQSCPFCREKWFSALQDDLETRLPALARIGCTA